MARSRKSPVVDHTNDSDKLASEKRQDELTLSQQKSAVESERTQTVENTPPVIERKMTLDEWVDSIISDKPEQVDEKSKEDERPTINLSRFGLKTPADVKLFLRSPAGEAVIGEIGAQLSLEKAIAEDQQLKAQEHRLMMSRLKALLFMWFLEDKADAADKLREFIVQQNELAVERAKPSTASSQTTDTKRQKELAESIAKYEDAVKQAQQNVAKGEVLQAQRAELVKEGERLEAKYQVYDTNLVAFENSPAASITLTSDQISEQAGQLSAGIDNVEHIAEMNEHAKMVHAALKNGNVHDARGLLLKAQIAQLSKQMDSKADEINDLLVAGKDDEARALLEEQNGLNLKAASLHDLLAVHEGKKHYVNDQGAQVHNLQQAQFILVIGQKLVKDEQGKMHLLQAHQDWDSVKNSVEAKELARKDYKELKPQVMCVKRVVSHNKGLETAMNKEQIADTDKLITENRAQGLVIANMISLQQAARSSAQNELNNAGPARNVPRPTPTAGGADVPKPSQASATLFYRQQIQELILAKHVNYQQLHTLADNLPSGSNRDAAIEYLRHMPRKGPIPPEQMRYMLQNMERFGIDATKPSVTNIQNPNEKVSNTPTPLSMMPDPLRGG